MQSLDRELPAIATFDFDTRENRNQRGKQVG